MKLFPLAMGFVVAMGLVSGARAADGPDVVVSIKPLYSLVASLMTGVGTPHLLVKGNASPHTYSLKPSDAKALAAAQLVVWVGPGMEPFLAEPLKTLGAKAQSIEALTLPGLKLLPNREGGVWDVDPDELEKKPGTPEVDEGPNNVHVWLDVDNAALISEAVARGLTAADPTHASLYEANLARVEARLRALDTGISQLLAPVKGKPFIVFHDAYPYLEERYGLKAVGSVTVVPDILPGPKRLKALRAKINDLGATCIFAEPYTQDRIVKAVVNGTRAKTSMLDPEGTGVDETPDLYFTLMESNARALAGCLGG